MRKEKRSIIGFYRTNRPQEAKNLPQFDDRQNAAAPGVFKNGRTVMHACKRKDALLQAGLHRLFDAPVFQADTQWFKRGLQSLYSPTA